jgi:hypothetical protein
MIRKYTVLIDSRDREYETYPDPGEYRIKLPREYKNVASARLLTLEMPSSYYVFSAATENVTMRIAVYNSAGTSIEAEESVSIPDGNYTSDTIVKALKTALTGAFVALGITFQIQMDPTTLKISISTVEGRLLRLDGAYGASDAPTQWGLAYYLGFDKSVYEAATLTSPRLVSLNPYTYILLDIEELNAVEEMGLYGDGTTGRGAFAKIPCAVNSFRYVSIDNSSSTTDVPLFPPLGKLHHLRIKFRFHDGHVVDFKDVEHSFSLEISCIHPGIKAAHTIAASPPPFHHTTPQQTTTTTTNFVSPPPPLPSSSQQTTQKKKWPWIIAALIAFLTAAVSRQYFFR